MPDITTEAGKRLAEGLADCLQGHPTGAARIAIIEAEAVAAERERIVQALRPLHERHRHPAAVIVLGEVLHIVRGEEAER